MFAAMLVNAGYKLIDRGIFSDYDFTKDDIIPDDTYYTLNLSSIIPKGTKAVLLQVRLEYNVYNKFIKIRKKGATNDYQAIVAATPEGGFIRFECIVFPNADREIEASLSSGDIIYAGNISIMGWWV